MDALDILQNDAFHKRVNGVTGGNRVLWGENDRADIYTHTLSLKLGQIVQQEGSKRVGGSTNVDKASLAALGIELRDFNPDDSAFLSLITNDTVDHMNDFVKVGGVDSGLFGKNAPVLDGHDSSKPPVATSSRPFTSGNNLLAISRFPKAGISANSDQIAGAVRARLMRGVSIGFIPLKWSFSKDPARPMGVDFHEVKLLEYSMCSIPANPDCYVLGSVASNQSAPSTGDSKVADRIREARLLAAQSQARIASIKKEEPAPTREQRMAEARNFRRIAMENSR